jgi:hypothetical protein
MKRKVRERIRCDFDKDRFTFIPPGDIVELTEIVIGGKRRVHWSGCKEGMGFVMVDDSELESGSDPL